MEGTKKERKKEKAASVGHQLEIDPLTLYKSELITHTAGESNEWQHKPAKYNHANLLSLLTLLFSKPCLYPHSYSPSPVSTHTLILQALSLLSPVSTQPCLYSHSYSPSPLSLLTLLFSKPSVSTLFPKPCLY